MVFFVYPNKEGFLIVMEDTSSLGPISVEAACLQESVPFLEKEMILDQLLLLLRLHVSKRIILSSKFTLETVTCLDDLLLNLVPLIFGDAWSKWEISEVTTDADSGTADHLSVFSWEWGTV